MINRSYMWIVALVSFCAAPAKSALITIEPDDYAVGTNLTRTLSDVHLFSFVNNQSVGPLSLGDVFVMSPAGCAMQPDDCYAVTGSRVFGRESDASAIWWDSPAAARCFERLLIAPCSRSQTFVALLIALENPTDYVEISGNFTADHPLIYTYDAARNLLGSAMTMNPWELGGLTTSTASFQSASANVSYVIAAGWAAGSSLDAFRYNDVSVPEPGTALLMTAGLLGALLVRRRRVS